jgi:hypothetical protein
MNRVQAQSVSPSATEWMKEGEIDGACPSLFTVIPSQQTELWAVLADRGLDSFLSLARLNMIFSLRGFF